MQIEQPISTNFRQLLVFSLIVLTLFIIGCGRNETPVDQSDINVNGVQLKLPFGGQGKHVTTGGETLTYEWIHDIGTLKLEGREVFWENKTIGVVGEKQHVVVSKEGVVSIVDN
ncbi:MAG: hypothetical protein KTR15_05950 [Phycisphaeraceae bacterium]|nr:hypothetical protein [Phycisphaeraceae bacterium]